MKTFLCAIYNQTMTSSTKQKQETMKLNDSQLWREKESRDLWSLPIYSMYLEIEI